MWLKHLSDHRRKDRSKWHISALLMEEYMRSKKSTGHPPHSPDSERHPVPFALSPNTSPRTSASKVRLSDGHVSFGPLVNYSHDSRDDSEIRGEVKVKGWRQSLPGFFETASSHVSFPYNTAASLGGLSPTSSRLNFPIVRRLRRRADESDEGSHSILGSQSEDQNDSGTDARRKARQRRDKAMDSDLQPARRPTPEVNNPTESSDLQLPAAPGPASAVTLQDPAVEPQTQPPQEDSNESGSKPSSEVPVWRSYRSTSLPLGNPISSKTHLDYEKSNLEAEYDLRSR